MARSPKTWLRMVLDRDSGLSRGRRTVDFFLNGGHLVIVQVMGIQASPRLTEVVDHPIRAFRTAEQYDGRTSRGKVLRDFLAKILEIIGTALITMANDSADGRTSS